ncbi:MAG: hypothetical protein JW749_01850 [Sedimentisphaerales bacterium]|nr:hypothetical protein [Sedimentisphaerales bacterium]
MKKLMALLIAFMMLGICSPSSGLLLIYKMSAPVKGVDDTTGLAVSVPLKAYLILDFDSEGAFRDANLITYGLDNLRSKVFYQLNDSDSDDFLDIALWGSGENVPYFFIGLWCYGSESPFEFEGCMWGKMSAKDIGYGPMELWVVPSSMKGVFTCWLEMLLDTSQDISGTGNLKAKLDTPSTKLLNAADQTNEEAVTYITGLLQAAGYSQGTPPKL